MRGFSQVRGVVGPWAEFEGEPTRLDPQLPFTTTSANSRDGEEPTIRRGLPNDGLAPEAAIRETTAHARDLALLMPRECCARPQAIASVKIPIARFAACVNGNARVEKEDAQVGVTMRWYEVRLRSEVR
jgi:hypothetical protein